MRRTLLVMAVTVVLLLAAVAVIKLRVVPPLVIPDRPILAGPPCQVATDSGRVALQPEQMANAATIAAVGLIRDLPDRAVQVALAAAMQESELFNLTYGDRDSLGLFQQRPSMGWGTVEQISDQRYAANAFYNSLVRVRGWEEMRVTDAAQLVQRSAFPEAYEKWADEAQVLTEALVGQAAATLSCIRHDDPPLRGPAAATALGDGLRTDWTNAASVQVGTGEISVAAPDDRIGWRYAHWLVAHSGEHGVQSVRFGEAAWDADSGKWSQVSANADDADRVVATVYPS